MCATFGINPTDSMSAADLCDFVAPVAGPWAVNGITAKCPCSARPYAGKI